MLFAISCLKCVLFRQAAHRTRGMEMSQSLWFLVKFHLCFSFSFWCAGSPTANFCAPFHRQRKNQMLFFGTLGVSGSRAEQTFTPPLPSMFLLFLYLQDTGGIDKVSGCQSSIQDQGDTGRLCIEIHKMPLEYRGWLSQLSRQLANSHFLPNWFSASGHEICLSVTNLGSMDQKRGQTLRLYDHV